MKKDIKSAATVESEAQTLETDKAASAARQESTTRNLHGSAAIDINTHHLDSKPVSIRQARTANSSKANRVSRRSL